MNLDLADHEVLAKHGSRDGCSDAPEIVNRPSKVRFVREHRNGDGTAAHVAPRVRHWVEVFANSALRWRAALDLGDHADSRLRFCRKRPNRRPLVGGALERSGAHLESRDALPGYRQNSVE